MQAVFLLFLEMIALIHNSIWAGEMARQVKVLEARPDDLS